MSSRVKRAQGENCVIKYDTPLIANKKYTWSPGNKPYHAFLRKFVEIGRPINQPIGAVILRLAPLCSRCVPPFVLRRIFCGSTPRLKRGLWPGKHLVSLSSIPTQPSVEHLALIVACLAPLCDRPSDKAAQTSPRGHRQIPLRRRPATTHLHRRPASTFKPNSTCGWDSHVQPMFVTCPLKGIMINARHCLHAIRNLESRGKTPRPPASA